MNTLRTLQLARSLTPEQETIWRGEPPTGHGAARRMTADQAAASRDPAVKRAYIEDRKPDRLAIWPVENPGSLTGTYWAYFDRWNHVRRISVWFRTQREAIDHEADFRREFADKLFDPVVPGDAVYGVDAW